MENAPLLPSNASGSESSRYYFLGKSSEDYRGGRSNLVRDQDGEQVVEGIPQGATEDEFAPKMLPPVSHPSFRATKAAQPNPNGSGGRGGGFFANLFGRKKSQRSYGEVGTLVKTRKAPIKIEPKVFFANERTFLAWLHLSVILAGASIAILAFAEDNNPFSQLYGVVLLPVAIAFIAYSLYQYGRRAAMIRTRHPGPYEDTVGPTVLGIMLMVSIVVQFGLKLYALEISK